MLGQTFIHVPGVGSLTEQRLWEQGCHTWQDYLASPADFRIGHTPRPFFQAFVDRSVLALQRGEHQMFAVTLPDKQAWRALPDFPSATCYLDIETDGGHAGDSVTVIGCYDGSTFDAFVRGENLESFRDYISRFSVIVTFFGTGFDLPMLRRRFPDIRWDQIHVDLCTAGRRIGYRGGLKAIEHTLGIQRSSETVGLTGFDAVRLWRSYQRGSDSALDQLVAYNREDTVNLKVLAEKFYPKLRDQTLSGELAPRAMRRNAKLAR